MSEIRRKIVQVSVSGVENTAYTQSSCIVVALCDDGTAWTWRWGSQDTWDRLPDIPQGEAGVEVGNG